MYWNGSGVSSIGIPNAGQDWHLLTVVFDIDTWAVYWDGQFVEELEHAMGPSSEVATHIGSSSTALGCHAVMLFGDNPLSSQLCRSGWM